MKIKNSYYTLEIYNKVNYENVKVKFFNDMLDLVSFTNKNARKYDDCYVKVINETDDTEYVYDGCIHVFNRKVNEILIQGDYSINN